MYDYYMTSKKKVQAAACLLIPSVFTVLLLYCGPLRYNISGLLALARTRILTAVLCLCAGVYYLVTMHTLLKAVHYPHTRVFDLAVPVSGLVCLLVKDDTEGGMQIHLLAGIILFLLLQCFVIILFPYDRSAAAFYCGGMVLCLGTILYTMNISGLTEIIYLYTFSIFLNRVWKRLKG